MELEWKPDTWRACGLSDEQAGELQPALEAALALAEPTERWQRLTADVLRPDQPWAFHQLVLHAAYRDWRDSLGPPPAWIPTAAEVQRTHAARWCRELGLSDFPALHEWSIRNRDEFWQRVLDELPISFHPEPSRILDTASGAESPVWLPGARYNIAEACWTNLPRAAALNYGDETGRREQWSRDELRRQVEQAARGLTAVGIAVDDRVAIMMPMTPEAIVAYLAIVSVGAVVVSIADSFAPHEIESRLRIADATWVVTQDVILRGVKSIPLYERLLQCESTERWRAIVCPARHGERLEVSLRSQDMRWAELCEAGTPVSQASFSQAWKPVLRAPDAVTNILFSSGTTGDPKAIPWTQLTPIKAAMDARLHHDIHTRDVLAWPTNLGWMMGPWLIYASLCNGASMAIYGGNPSSTDFARFVGEAGVTMLGVIPSLVRSWREQQALDNADWTGIRRFSSTGECSDPDDMLFLMSRAGYRPVIEYCGGTEIGGGYITGSMMQPAAPATFTTPALGLDLVLWDDDAGHATDKSSSDQGEVFLVPPSIGLSQSVLNRDHHAEYYAGVPHLPQFPCLRRHGDVLQPLPGGYYRALGRNDDTMNLGGIKVGSAELERCLNEHVAVRETAAVAVSPAGGGPAELAVFVVLNDSAAETDPQQLLAALQQQLRQQLNPLFKIAHLQLTGELPRTASNKVMRRELRVALGNQR